MPAEVTERAAAIRGVNVRWFTVEVARHTVEEILLCDVAEAESVCGKPFDDELEKHTQWIAASW